MIRTLQKKFILTAQLAVTVLLVVLLAAINVFDLVFTENRVGETLSMLAETLGEPQRLIPPEFAGEDAKRDDDHRAPWRDSEFPEGRKNDYDVLMSSNFFLVCFDEDGEVTRVDCERTSAVDEEDAIELAESALAGAKETGVFGRFHYRVADLREEDGKCVVFLDVTDEYGAFFNVLLISIGGGIVAWALMLVFVIALSRRVIRPIAENMERQKQFVTNAGHELKTPLAIIRSNTEAMELYSGESKYSRNIKEQTTRLSGLTDRLLKLSRMEEAQTWTPERFSLSDLCESFSEAFSEPIGQKRISFSKEIAPGIDAFADKARIEELFSILFENAVKYSDEDGEIRVSLAREGKHIRFDIENTCRDLPDCAPERLFDRFYRADGARTQGSSGGFGVGLSVAKTIAEKAGKGIYADYLAPDRIRFTVIF